MRKKLDLTEGIFPMPVLMVAPSLGFSTTILLG